MRRWWAEPSGVNSRVSRKRSSLVCRTGGASPISSRNRVPPSACSISPGLDRWAVEWAPRSNPNSSLSSSSAGRAAQLMAKKAPGRSLAAWMARAWTSLPTPVSPSSRISACERASLRSLSRSTASSGDRVEVPPMGARSSSSMAAISTLFSRRNTSAYCPSRISEPLRSGVGRRTVWPSTTVPLVLSQSSRKNPVLLFLMTAW